MYLAASAINTLLCGLPAGTTYFIGVVLITMMTGQLVHHQGSLARAAWPFVAHLRWGWHRVERALENFFTAENLSRLRELALEEIASALDRRRQKQGGRADNGSDRIMVCTSSRSPNAHRLLRKAARLADLAARLAGGRTVAAVVAGGQLLGLITQADLARTSRDVSPRLAA